MTRECHVRFWEHLGGKFPGVTRQPDLHLLVGRGQEMQVIKRLAITPAGAHPLDDLSVNSTDMVAKLQCEIKTSMSGRQRC